LLSHASLLPKPVPMNKAQQSGRTKGRAPLLSCHGTV
jgi:hypothetical protein